MQKIPASKKIVQMNIFLLTPGAKLPRWPCIQPQTMNEMNTIQTTESSNVNVQPRAAAAAGANQSDAAPATERGRDWLPEYPIFKPNSRGSGGVMRFGLNRNKAAVFVDAAPQAGERQFDWERKITMKWGLSDLGAVLAVVQGRQPTAKLFHQSDAANSAFEMTRRDDPDRAPFLLSLSRQLTQDKSVRKVTIPVTHAEAAVLDTLLRTAVVRLLEW